MFAYIHYLTIRANRLTNGAFVKVVYDEPAAMLNTSNPTWHVHVNVWLIACIVNDIVARPPPVGVMHVLQLFTEYYGQNKCTRPTDMHVM